MIDLTGWSLFIDILLMGSLVFLAYRLTKAESVAVKIDRVGDLEKTLRKINQLIEDIVRNGNEGVGKPEALSGNLVGFWSRRINDKDRLIYKIDKENIYVLACRYHYGDK